MPFDVAGAIKAGATPDQIASFLAEKQGFDLEGALGSGASVDQVIGFLSKSGGKEAGFVDRIVDTGIDAAKGVIGAGEALVGLGNLATGNMIGNGLSKIGYDPKRSKEMLESGYSAERQEENAAVRDSKGFVGTARSLLENPAVAIGSMVESAPMMLGSMGAVRAAASTMMARAGIAPGSAAAAEFLRRPDVLAKLGTIGSAAEGAATAGSIQEQARQEGAGYSDSAGYALAGGAGTALIGKAASKILPDADVIAGTFGMGRRADGAGLIGAAKGVGKGMAQEGALEEMPQSAQEQAFTNLATGRPWNEGVAESAAQGLIVGAAMGGGVSLVDSASRRRAVAEQSLQQATDAAGAAAAANEMATVDLDTAINEVEQSVSAYLQPNGAIPTPEQAVAEPEPQPLTPQEKQELARQQLQAAPIEDPLAELRLQAGPTTTMADIARRRDEVETAAIEQMMAEEKAAPQVPTAQPVPDLAQASEQETSSNHLAGLEQQSRQRMVDTLVQSAAEPSGYFASRMIPAIDQQLSVLNQPPLTREERARVVSLSGAAQAFSQPTMPEAPAPVIKDTGTDNSSMEARIPEKIPRPSRILGQPTASYSDEQLTAMASKPDIPAVSRRSASIELTARQAEQPSATQEQPATAPPVAAPPVAAPPVAAPPVAAGREGYDTPAVQGGFVVQMPQNMSGTPSSAMGSRVDAKAGPGFTAADVVRRDPIAGQKINDEWTAFADQSGTMGIPRAEMPQIKSEDRGAMVNFLKARGIDSSKEQMPPTALKPTQAEFSPAKVQKAADRTDGDRSIIVSADGYVVDGHHQWLAQRQKGQPVNVIRLDQPITQVLDALKEMPSAQPEQKQDGATRNTAQKQAQPSETRFVVKTDPVVGTKVEWQEKLPNGSWEMLTTFESIEMANQAVSSRGYDLDSVPVWASYWNAKAKRFSPAKPAAAQSQADVTLTNEESKPNQPAAQQAPAQPATENVADVIKIGRNQTPLNEDGRQDTTGSLFSRERESKLSTPSDGRIVNVDAEITGKAPVPGSKQTIQDGDTSHTFTVVDASRLGSQGRLIQQIARTFGKRLVAFESETLQADGFVRDGDQSSIYLNVESEVSPMAVFGHELTHQMKRDSPKAYAALEAVVRRNIAEGGMERFSAEYGEGADLEELSSDLVGNRFREPDFWEDVFNEVAAQNDTGAAAIVQRVGQSIRRAVDALLQTIQQYGFNADAYVTNLEEIRDAVRVAMVDYAKQQRTPAMTGVNDAVAVARANAKSMARGDVGGGVKFSRTGGTDQTMTEAFKRWFGDSPNTEGDGSPIIFYHGGESSFSQIVSSGRFGQGIFVRQGKPSGYGSAQHALYLRAPILELDELGDLLDDSDGAAILESLLPDANPDAIELVAEALATDEHYPESQEVWDAIGAIDEADAQVETQKLRGKVAQKLGYAAVRQPDEFDGETVMVLDPSAIKSATENSGNFDPINPDIRNSRRRHYGTLTPAQEQALRNVGGITVDQTVKERFDQLRSKLSGSAAGIADQFAELEALDKDAYIEARLSKGTDGTVEALMLYGKPFINKDGVLDVSILDDGFAKVLGRLEGEQDRFLWWVAAQRAERLKSQGLERLFTDQDIGALKELNKGNLPSGLPRGQAYARALQEMNDFNDAVMKVAQASGLIDDATRKLFKDMPYVPFYRVMEEEGGVSGPSFSGGLTNQSAWKKLKGGKQKLHEDLLSNVLQNWSHLYAASAKNRAANAALKAGVRAGIAERVPAGTKGSVRVRENGLEVHYLVHDEGVMAAISAIEYRTPRLFRILGTFKRMLSLGVTASPTYKVKNLIRDSVSAVAISDLSYNAAGNVYGGFKATSKDSQTFASMLAGGGLIRFGTMLDGNNADRTRKMVAKEGGILLNRKGWQKLSGMAADTWEAYNEIGDRFENANRAALYEQLMKKGYSQKEANFMARDLMDFTMQGRWPLIRFLTETVPFMNARIQGLYKLGKAAKADPQKFGYVVGAVAMASIALMLAYEDDEDWKERPDWDRDANWWFKIGDMSFRIPKPFEVGAIGTLAERGWELAFNKEMSVRRFGKSLSNMIFDTFAMDPTPQLVKPLIDIYANRAGFTNRAIENMAMQRLRPEDRYTDRTSYAARFLGNVGLPSPMSLSRGQYESMSPMQIDHLIRGYFGWLGTAVTTTVDVAMRPMMGGGERPDMRLKDMFFVGNFAETLPAGSSRYLDQVYEQSKEIEQAYNSHRAALKRGDKEEAKKIYAEEMDKIKAHKKMSRYNERISEISGKIKRVESSQSLSGDTKRKMIDELTRKRNEVAKRASLSVKLD